MKQILGFPKAVYNFFVGDPFILVGVVAFFIVVGQLAGHNDIGSKQPVLMGGLLIAGVILSLGVALYRETRPKR